MSKVVHKANLPGVVEKATGKDAYTFVISSETPDLVGDIVVQSGMRPVSSRIPAQIDHSGRVKDLIGTWENIKTVGKKTYADLKLLDRGVSEVSDFVRTLLDMKIPMAASIGFKGEEVEPVDPKDPWGGLKFIKSMLVECSVVTVPCNPEALSVAKSLNIPQETIDLLFTKPESAQTTDALRRAKNLLKSIPEIS